MNVEELAKKSRTSYGMKLEQTSTIIDIDNFKDSDGFKRVLGYIPRATFEGSSSDSKGRGWRFHYLKYDLRGEPAYIVIREIKGKNTFYSIVEQLNKK